MKKNMFAVILILSLGALSCSSSVQFDEGGDKVLKSLIKEIRYRENVHEFSEVKLVRDVTAEDSLNFKLNNQEFLEKLIADHNRLLRSLQREIENPYFASHDNLIADVNRFADAFDGKFDDKEWGKSWNYKIFYKEIYRLKNLPKDQVIAKIYSVTNKRKEDKVWSTDYWILKPDLSGTYQGKIDVERTKAIPKSNFDLERIHFKRFENDNK